MVATTETSCDNPPPSGLGRDCQRARWIRNWVGRDSQFCRTSQLMQQIGRWRVPEDSVEVGIMPTMEMVSGNRTYNVQLPAGARLVAPPAGVRAATFSAGWLAAELDAERPVRELPAVERQVADDRYARRPVQELEARLLVAASQVQTKRPGELGTERPVRERPRMERPVAEGRFAQWTRRLEAGPSAPEVQVGGPRAPAAELDATANPVPPRRPPPRLPARSLQQLPTQPPPLPPTRPPPLPQRPSIAERRDAVMAPPRMLQPGVPPGHIDPDSLLPTPVPNLLQQLRDEERNSGDGNGLQYSRFGEAYSPETEHEGEGEVGLRYEPYSPSREERSEDS